MAGLTQNRVEMLEPLAPRLVLKAGTQWFARLGHWAATAFIVTILLAAAGLKIHSSLAANADSQRLLPIVIALGEILLSILILVKQTRSSCWVASGCLFAMFAAYNSYQSLQGVAECGCFGTLNPSPTTVLVIDLFALLLIIAIPPRIIALKNSFRASSASFRYQGLQKVGFFVFILLLSVNAFAWVSTSTLLFAEVKVAEGVGLHGNVLTLEPSRWLGKPLPIRDQLSAWGSSFDRGKCTVWIVDLDCRDCKQMISDISSGGSRTNSLPDVVVSLSSRVSDGELEIESPHLLVQFVPFKTSLKVHCPVPCIVVCENSEVVSVSFPR